MKIAILGKFQRLHDEEYLARTFESLGHEVLRIPESMDLDYVYQRCMEFRPQIVFFCKLNNHGNVVQFFSRIRELNIRPICWIFDLYFSYAREYRLNSPQFKADFVFSTDGGHDAEFKEKGINHHLLRQGIYKPECYVEPLDNPHGVVFVGSHNPLYPRRREFTNFVSQNYEDFRWLGRDNTEEVRGTKLNELYATAKIVVGDSVYSPFYWSNRVVETLGRGGFLIHQDVEGLREQFPHLVTYIRGDFDDLKAKIDYFMTHEDERREIIRKNHEYVLEHYTADKKCKELIDTIYE
jgi:hypothetical protein